MIHYTHENQNINTKNIVFPQNIELEMITERLESMNYDDLMNTLMHIEILAAVKNNKIVFSGCEDVQ